MSAAGRLIWTHIQGEVRQMHIQIINFNLTGLSEQDFLATCEKEFAPAFAAVPGLVSKVRLANSETNTYGGVYTWRDQQAMAELTKSELFNAVANHPNFENIESTDFGLLEGPTKVTNGLAEATA